MPERTDEHGTPLVPEKRHKDEAFKITLFRRTYSMTSVLQFVVLLGLVGGTVGWCADLVFAKTLGKTIVDSDEATVVQLRDTASAAFRQSRMNAQKVDSMAASVNARMTRLENIALMLGEIKCKEMVAARVAYLPPTCRDILRDAAR